VPEHYPARKPVGNLVPRVPREVLPFSSVPFRLTGPEGKVIDFMQADRGVFAKYHF
jgi:hypothetical protein